LTRGRKESSRRGGRERGAERKMTKNSACRKEDGRGEEGLALRFSPKREGKTEAISIWGSRSRKLRIRFDALPEKIEQGGGNEKKKRNGRSYISRNKKNNKVV